MLSYIGCCNILMLEQSDANSRACTTARYNMLPLAQPSSCRRIRFVISFQIAKSITFSSGLRLGMRNSRIFKRRLAARPAFERKPVGSLS